MKKVILVFYVLTAFTHLTACSSRKTSGNVAVGGVGTVKEVTMSDEMLARQKKEQERHEKEIQDIKRQEYYDQKYRQYIKDRQ